MDNESFEHGDDVPISVPFKPLAGNTSDDDGLALDDYFRAADSGPLSFGDSQWTDSELPITTRIISRSITLMQGADPIMIFGPDPNRVSVTIEVAFGDGTEFVNIASDKSDVYGSARLFPNRIANDNLNVFFGELVLENHTGAIWAYYTGALAAGVTINSWCVTS